MKLFAVSFDNIVKNCWNVEGIERKSVEDRSLNLCRRSCTDVSKVMIMSKISFLSELKIVVVSKMEYVSKLKNRPLGKVVHGGVDTLTALTTANDEILVKSEQYSRNLALLG